MHQFWGSSSKTHVMYEKAATGSKRKEIIASDAPRNSVISSSPDDEDIIWYQAAQHEYSPNDWTSVKCDSTLLR
jgi:hypothetical protein